MKHILEIVHVNISMSKFFSLYSTELDDVYEDDSLRPDTVFMITFVVGKFVFFLSLGL